MKWRLGIGGAVSGLKAGGDRDTRKVINKSYDCSKSRSTSGSAITRLENVARRVPPNGHLRHLLQL
jgi:hypothetical protein